jgi:hypothetical protein
MTQKVFLQGLTLNIADSHFASSAGPAVAWSPAVPGRLQGCNAVGRDAATKAFYPICDFSELAAGVDAVPQLLAYPASQSAARKVPGDAPAPAARALLAQKQAPGQAPCAPGWVPVISGGSAALASNVTAMESEDREGQRTRCMLPLQVPLNEPVMVRAHITCL